MKNEKIVVKENSTEKEVLELHLGCGIIMAVLVFIVGVVVYFIFTRDSFFEGFWSPNIVDIA
ncbi:MAG: hypothetical protein FWC89_02485 [Defluviitaleaceae bacterium]|nr:hypothetical protein [Defluviitaleaceae bacterium]